jgi:outer membrane protein insertion porin family
MQPNGPVWVNTDKYLGDIVRKAMPAPQLGSEMKQRVLSGCLFLLLAMGTYCRGQVAVSVSNGEPAEHFAGTSINSHGSSGAAGVNDDRDPAPLTKWQGLRVRDITFEGVSAERLQPLPGHLPQAVGAPLDRESVADSLRKLYATGLFDTIEANVIRQDDGVKLVFRGTPREFIGTVNVNGARGATINAQLQAASRLTAGTRFTQTRLEAAIVRMRQTLADNGFNEPVITYKLTRHSVEQLVDIAFEVTSGVQSRVGDVAVSGDSGMTLDQFRHDARLKAATKVDHDTNNRALSGVLKRYQKQDRLEADVKLLSQAYSPETKRSNFSFSANRGPVVKLSVEGAKIGGERLKRLVPIFEEGTVDEDLLNEGDRRLRDYFQRMGYFDVKVEHKEQNPGGGTVNINYTVALGERRRVEKVSVDGNQYFNAKTLEELLSVHAADHLDRHGTYSQALVTADVNALLGVYQNNGFSKVKVTPETLIAGKVVSAPGQETVRSSTEPISVVYHIEEGQQQRVGELRLDGVANSDQSKLMALLNTSPGQLFSPQNLAGDRDALLTDYLSRGFDQVQVEVEEQTEAADPAKIDVVFQIHEGLHFIRATR